MCGEQLQVTFLGRMLWTWSAPFVKQHPMVFNTYLVFVRMLELHGEEESFLRVISEIPESWEGDPMSLTACLMRVPPSPSAKRCGDW